MDSYFNIVHVGSGGLNTYFILDTLEGSDCFGHWMIECAVFLPVIVKLRQEKPNIKILLHCKRRYKINLLSDFDIPESDIVYSKKRNTAPCECDKYLPTSGSHLYHGYVLPEEDNYIAYIPHITFGNAQVPRNMKFLSLLEGFKEYYGINTEVIKDIPVLYLIRSRKENYASPNTRTFENINEMIDLCKKYNIYILDIDTLDTIREQIDIVKRSNVLIYEYGSAIINAIFFAKDSHAIVLNHYNLISNMEDSNDFLYSINNIEYTCSKTTTDDWHIYRANIPEIESILLKLMESI